MTANSAAPVRFEYWTPSEVAKYLKGSVLRHAFPGTKFSVRNGRGTAWGYLSVEWSGGPSEDEVRKVCDPWQGEDFDGMTDQMNPRHEQVRITAPDGTPVLVTPETYLIEYTRRRPEGVEDAARAIVGAQLGKHWMDCYWGETGPVTYQGHTYRDITPWALLNRVMDALESGEITPPGTPES